MKKMFEVRILAKLLVVILILCCSGRIMAQSGHGISGLVTDNTGEPIPGVNVVEKGTTNGTITDMDGEYNLTLSGTHVVVSFSFVGMDTQEVLVENKTRIDVTLKSGVDLDEMVVVGYGTQRAQDVTGAITKVSVADIEKTTNTTIEQALQGRIAGVNTTSNDGSLGGGIRVRIRGGTSINANNEPLYVIDGIPIEVDYNNNSVKNAMDGLTDDSPLANLDPGSIESMEVLKDASAAAIYGSRGANGVIIITTKSGKAGKTKINVDSKVSVSYVPEERFVGVMDASQYGRHLINKQQYPNGVYDPGVTFTGEMYGEPYTNKEELQALYDNGPNTNWQEEYYGVGIIQNHSLSATGGKDGNTFAIRGAYLRNEGTLKNSYFERYNFNVNLKNKLAEKLTFTTNLAPSYSDKEGPTSAGGFTSRQMGSVVKTLSRQPNRVVGEVFEDGDEDGVWVDPVTEALKTQNKTQNFNFTGKADLIYEIFDGLSAQITLGANYTDSKQKAYYPKEFGRGYQNGGIGTRFHYSHSNISNQNMLTYKKKINKHSINAVGVFEQSFITRDTEYIYNTNFPLEDFGYDALQFGLTPNIPETFLYKKVMKSYLGRVNYNFDNRYNLSLSFRADGSSVFANDKWGYFPAAAASWNAHNESFLRDVAPLSILKLRFSYGQTGNAGIGYYDTYPTMNPSNYVFGGSNTLYGGLGMGTVGNPDLRWEFTDQYDLGLEVGLFNDRIHVNADVYYKETKDLLLEVPTSPSTSFDKILMNNGSVENKGIELALTTVNIDGAFKWSTEFTFAMNRNKVLDLGGQYEQLFTDQFSNGKFTGLLRVGESLGNWIGYKTNGVFTYDDFDIPVLPDGEPDYANAVIKPEVKELYGNYNNDENPAFGDIRYIDGNKDGSIDSNDRTIIARTQPKHFGSMYNSFSFKGIDLGVFFTYKYGFDVINGNRHRIDFKGGGERWNKTIEAVDAWTPENPDGQYFRPDYVNDGNVTDWIVEDGSFIRLQSINLGYNFPARVAKKMGLRSLKLYTAIDNVYIWTNYSGYDPEVSVAQGQRAITSANLDYGAYPRTLNISFGVNVGL